MNKNTKLKLGSLMLLPFILTGCENDIDDSVEVVDEFLLAGSDVKDETTNNEEVSEKDNEKVIESEKDASKKEESILVNKSENTESKKENVTEKEDNKDSNNESVKENTNVGSTILANAVLQSNPVFTKSEIPEDIKEKMMGKSMTADASISFEELSYLTISHLDYNGNTKIGHMVVNAKLADEVLAIFKDIYNGKFPIEKMNLVDEYGASDHASMVANNSSAFCYRTIAGTNKVSKHGMGVAIDINPFYNPHVLKSKGTVNPPEASKYANRSLNEKGMIKVNDVVYKAFTSRGWKWGGHWNNPDYQHFEKNI